MKRHALWGAIAAQLVAGAVTVATAGPIYTWGWTQGGGGSYSNNAGKINWVETQLDTNTSLLRYTANFGETGSTLKTDGFTLCLTPGTTPTGYEGELALIYVDTHTAFNSPGGSPALTVYGFNGLTNASSYFDGKRAAGVQAPDALLSSHDVDAASWLTDFDFWTNGDGTRTMTFELDVRPIQQHLPMYNNPMGASWYGAGYAENIGLKMRTYSTLSASYADGYLTNWGWRREGYLDVMSATTPVDTPIDPVPEPATIALLGLGTAGYLTGSLRRRRSNRSAS
jgi:hypothetical protein